MGVQDPRFITNREAARRLGVHPNTIRNWCNSGVLRSSRMASGFRRIWRLDVERLEREISRSVTE